MKPYHHSYISLYDFGKGYLRAFKEPDKTYFSCYYNEHDLNNLYDPLIELLELGFDLSTHLKQLKTQALTQDQVSFFPHNHQIWYTKSNQKKPFFDFVVDRMFDEPFGSNVVLDLQRKTLLIFVSSYSEPDNPYFFASYRRACFAFLREHWQGWKIQWATGGFFEVAESCHFDLPYTLWREEPDSETKIGNQQQEYDDRYTWSSFCLEPDNGRDIVYEGEWISQDWPQTAFLQAPDKYFRIVKDYLQSWVYQCRISDKEEPFALITVRDSENNLKDYICDSFFSYHTILRIGPDILPILEDMEPAEKSIWWGSEDAYGGMFVDMLHQQIWFWSEPQTDPRYLNKIRSFWPGWQVDNHSEGVYRQMILSGRNPEKELINDDVNLYQKIYESWFFAVLMNQRQRLTWAERLEKAQYVNQIASRLGIQTCLEPEKWKSLYE